MDSDGAVGADGSAEDGPPPVKETLRDVAEAAAKGAGRARGAPKEPDLEDVLVLVVGFASALFVWWLVAGQGLKRAQRREYELTEDQAVDIVAPLSRIVERSWVNRRYGKQILGSFDWIVMGIALQEYGEVIAPLVQRKFEGAKFPQFSRQNAGAPRRGAVPNGTAPPPRTPEEVDSVDEQLARPAPDWYAIHPSGIYGASAT